MSALVNISGWSSDDKTPGFYRQTTYRAGNSALGANPRTLLLTGTKIAAGSATPDLDFKDVTSEADADAYFGAGSELACMCYAAIIPGVTLKAAAVAEAGGAAAATMKIKITGSWSTTGTIYFYFAGKTIPVQILSTDSKITGIAAVTAAFNADPRLPVTAADDGVDECTLTTKSKGARANDWVLDYDLAIAPSGLGITLTGGSALNGNAKPFANGSGADSLTNVLALFSQRYDYIGWAQYDGTAITAIKTKLDAEANTLVAHLDHGGLGSARALATANTLSNTTINHERMMNPWCQNCQWPPSMIAAHIMAIRSVEEAENPNFNYDGYVTGIPAQRNQADIPLHASLKSALNNGVTPLVTKNGKVVIVRAITTKCKDGTAFDYSTLDVGVAVVPDRVSDELDVQWSTASESNPYAGPDSADGKLPPEGRLTPTLWNSDVYKVLKDKEAKNWLQQVDQHLPESAWDATRKAIVSAVPTVVADLNHQGGADVRQTVAT